MLCVIMAACFISFSSSIFVNGYELPKPVFTAKRFVGLQVLIPDDGYSLFSFHGNINKKIEVQEPGTIHKEVTRALGGAWTFTDRRITIDNGDIIYYWIYVIKDGLGYLKSGEWKVIETSDSPISNFLPREVIVQKFTRHIQVNADELPSTSKNRAKNGPRDIYLPLLIILWIVLTFT